MAAFLDRIEKLNPIHNAIISLRPRDELMAEARAADAAPSLGKLHGLPMAIKDLAMTKGLRTTYGSPIFAQNVPEEDDLFVARIRAAGAIIIGKTNTPEFGLGSQTYNPVFGTTRNALNPALIAGGSSGGAAVAVVARATARGWEWTSRPGSWPRSRRRAGRTRRACRWYRAPCDQGEQSPGRGESPATKKMPFAEVRHSFLPDHLPGGENPLRPLAGRARPRRCHSQQ
jgi:hypothetical protein